MKTSIRKQFAIITISLLMLTLAACWFINDAFLEKYYERDKKEIIQTAYEKLNSASVDGTIEEEDFQEEMMEYSIRYNVRVYVINSNAKSVVIVPFSDIELRQKLYDYILKRPLGILDGPYPEPNTIFRIRNIMNQTQSIEMYGQLENG